MAEPRCCNPQAAIERLAGNVELYRDVVRNFMADAAGVISQIRAAIGAADGDTLHRAAHNFKGSAGLCGADRVAQACAELERIGLQFDAPQAERAAQELDEAIAATRIELRPYQA